MIEKIVRLILNGADVSQILALTFTKKAAQQMKDKLKSALVNAINDENTPKEDRLAIRKCGPSSWEVFYTEKGSVYDRKVFSSEKEACVYMLQRLIPGFQPEDFLKLL